jgi:ABC-2 type transport system ATP-binding protein
MESLDNQATPAIEAVSLSKRYRIYHNKSRTLKETLLRGRGDYEEFWALQDFSLRVAPGESVGIIGANGSGKSTLLKLVARIIRPDDGAVRANGTVSALLEVGAGFHPEYTGRENIYLYGALLGLTKAEVDERYGDIIAFSGLERFIDNPVKNYSSGMFMRLGFSVAIHVDPDILLIDEVLAVGDAAFQRRCLERIADLRGAGKTIVFVSHDLGTMRELCRRAIWIDKGRLVVDGPTDRAIGLYTETMDQSSPASQPVSEQVERWGSGEATIDGVRVLDSAGDEQTALRHGQAGTIRLEVGCTTRLRDLAVGIGVFTRDGTYCTGVNMAFDACSVTLEPGPHVLELELPSVDLLPGSYLLDLAVFDAASQHIYDILSRTTPLTVSGEASAEGIFRIPHRWRVDGVAPG